MPTDHEPEDFELLLAWLGPDREQAGEKYERLRRNLFDYFRRRGVADPDGLADEVFVRVTKKVREISPGFVGDPAPYFLAVARLVLAEWRRLPPSAALSEDIPALSVVETGVAEEPRLQALEECWKRLDSREQGIVLRYYAGAGQKRRAGREQLARELGVTGGALRVITHRLRGRLRRCIEKLVRAKNPETVTRILHK